MIPGIEQTYVKMAAEVCAAIPVSWTSAKCEAVFYPDSIDFFGEYAPVNGPLRSFRVSRNATRIFEELRQKFKEAGQPVWGQASFNLVADGKFNMTWGYDNCDENGDTVWDEEEWRRRQEERHQRLSQPQAESG